MPGLCDLHGRRCYSGSHPSSVMSGGRGHSPDLPGSFSGFSPAAGILKTTPLWTFQPYLRSRIIGCSSNIAIPSDD